MPKFGNYCCPACGLIARDVEVPFGTSFTEVAVYCPMCAAVGGLHSSSLQLEWIPQIGRISAGGGPTFTAFETTDAFGKLVRVDSITALRKIERESEKAEADGVGQKMVWRDLANDRSNRYDHAITKSWEPADYPGVPGKEQRAALKMLSSSEGEAKLVEMQKAAAEIASATAPPAEV